MSKEWVESYVEERITEKDPQLCTGNSVAQDINNLAVEFQKHLSKHWASENVGKISVGLDCWTAPNRSSYFGVTASWIDEDWILRRGVIGMEYFKPPHTGLRMAELLIKILKEYDLNTKHIMSLVCDNASNNNTMVDELIYIGFEGHRRLRCVLHVLNLAAKAALRVFDFRSQNDAASVIMSNTEATEVESDTESEREPQEDDFDDVGDCNEEYFSEILQNIQGSYLPSVDNCRKFVRTVRATQRHELSLKVSCSSLNIPYTALVKDMPVRWNITFDMIK